ncbi:MAG: aminotransferase class I/II-fold pyridoxal phosphate-dependent enzyme [Ruminococcus bromii]|nr:aminotransferase class I/II-fold pyridoxal phosphate-dependent enzyme [Ruminococcus bromii]MCI7211805.1 aminotransferase class I/II-fold pyridoxal phosphate-dependent enzyme [Ruminococcus bromii]MDD6434362.1 aminotransferase class I/II-fold pyridoxal phosphate-dependent enzyme [Ruminococcus bromii]MDY4085314.1 aminotransferase class I/II-fold pyridoxal phosphate-dependent enzyme [Ruminococcus bromii]MDY4710730.1 aminotransferase class I/II-fold pyridoxal phosphate-dependent enzyme [Ruminococ
MNYLNCSKQELEKEYSSLVKQFEDVKSKGLNLNMARGKPGKEQLDLSLGLLDVVNSSSDFVGADGMDCRNYGILKGIEECRKLFGEMLGVDYNNVMVGGSSSLNMMFDTISCMMTKSVVDGCKPWYEVKNRKFLCPVPGYDRHFGITEYYGFEMIPVPMTSNGPDMDIVEKLVENDDSIKGIWCVPKYSNPQGITYSDDTVKRFAALKPAAKDFRIMWDNAYCIHDISDTPDSLLNIYDECVKAGNEDMPILFCSTSKITFPGAGVAAMAASDANMNVFAERYNYEIISYDKLNMLRHVKYFKNYDGVLKHMQLHKKVLKPKFEIVLNTLDKELTPTGVGEWTNPNGGYFVSVDVLSGTAKRVVSLCKEAGLILTGAGATYPLGKDPEDKNIRIAPSFPPNDELQTAMNVFCICTKLAACEKLLG